MTSPGPEPIGRVDFDVVVLPSRWRAFAAALKLVARGSLLVMAAAWLLSGDRQGNSLQQMRVFVAFFLAPEAALWCIRRAFAATLYFDDASIVLDQSDRRAEISIAAIQRVEEWRVPLPDSGIWLRLTSGNRFPEGIAFPEITELLTALIAHGAAPVPDPALAPDREVPGAPVRRCGGLRSQNQTRQLRRDRAGFTTAAPINRALAYARALSAGRNSILDHPFLKFVLFPLIPALPAFRLHQYITYGGTFGEYHTFGLQAYLVAFVIWWISWAIGLLLFAAVVRLGIELGTALLLLLRPAWMELGRKILSGLGRAAFYAGVPAWLLLRLWFG